MYDLGVETKFVASGAAVPVIAKATPVPPGLSPVCGRAIVARFDSPLMSSDGGLLALREVELRLGIAQRLAGCISDPRAPGRVQHGLDEIIRIRMLMIAAGYEDGNDADTLRADPMFKLAMGRLPDAADLCSQPTISRFENLPDGRARLRMARAMIDHYCASFRQVPSRIVLDIDDTFDAVHGGQQLRLFNAHYDEYGFQPIVVFDGGGRMIAAVLRPACKPTGVRIVKWLRRFCSLYAREHNDVLHAIASRHTSRVTFISDGADPRSATAKSMRCTTPDHERSTTTTNLHDREQHGPAQ